MSNDAIEEAWAALDEGRPEDALAVLADLDEDSGTRWSTEVLARIELGDLAAAEEAHARARERSGRDDPDFLWASGELHLLRWRTDKARAAFARLVEVDPSTAAYERLSLCLDLAEDYAAADEALNAAHAIDPEQRPVPPRLDPDAFDAIVHEAIGELPEPFRQALETTALVIDPMPGPGAVVGEGTETPPDLLGLFVGASLLDRGLDDSGEIPPTIYLFRRNLERLCRDHAELREEIRVTLYHEVGHALGFDEDGVEDMGLA